MIEPHENLVVIVGPPAAGKTSVADELAKSFPDYKVYHSDDYMDLGFVESMYKLMEDIKADPSKKIIVEGIQAARLLRKGVETGTLFADLVIEVDSPEKEIRYSQRHGGETGKGYPHGTAKGLVSVMNQYRGMSKREPRTIKLTT